MLFCGGIFEVGERFEKRSELLKYWFVLHLVLISCLIKEIDEAGRLITFFIFQAGFIKACHEAFNIILENSFVDFCEHSFVQFSFKLEGDV